MSQHAIGGLFVGLMALVVSAAVVLQAVATRRRRVEIADTYNRSGGIAYTAIQFGCAGIIALFGLGLLVLVALNPTH